MSLDALAPDQRAVVQLVLQQERAYGDLAVLLGISAEAVRERAHRGLERLAPGEAVDPLDRGEIADYLLGQQSVSEREATRSLLSESQSARSWAEVVAAQLSGIARSGLPEIPAGASPPRSRPEPIAPAAADEPVFLAEEPLVDEEPAVEPAPTRARPRPRARAAGAGVPAAGQAPPDFGFDTDLEPDPLRDPADPRSSRLGGMLLIIAMAVAVATLIIVLVTRGGNDNGTQTATNSSPTTPSASASATPAGTGTPDANGFQAIGTLPLTAAGGGKAQGEVVVFANQAGQIAFNLSATDVPPNAKGEAYGVWLTGGKKPRFLGFPTQAVGDDGKLAVSGPRQEDAAKLTSWLQSAKRLVVSRETKSGASEPGPLVLIGDLRAQVANGDGGAAPGGTAPGGTAPGGTAPAPGGSGTAPAPTP